MGDFFLQHQLHQLFGWGRHIFESLTKGNNGKYLTLQGFVPFEQPPAVKGDFSDVVPGAQFVNEASIKP